MKTCLSILAALIVASASMAAEPLAARLHSKDFGTRMNAIKEVADLPGEDRKKHFHAVVGSLKDKDQSIRIVAAGTIARMTIEPQKAIPALINNFTQPHGEEGMEYVSAVAAYGEAAVPYVSKALESPEWLVRTRACDTLIKIGRRINKAFQCEQG